MDKYALITGTTSGIGKALSIRFAQENINLILVSRNPKKLKKQARLISSKYKIKVNVIIANLEEPNISFEIYNQVNQMGVKISYLVNNAGFNQWGAFIDADINNQINMIKVHIVNTTELMKLFIPEMIKSKYGRVLNIGSTASFIPCPNSSVYAATKAYILSVSKAIGSELKGTGVTITTLCPGATYTEFAHKAGMEDTLLYHIFVMNKKTVTNAGFKALMKGKTYVVPGVYNKLIIYLSKILPDFITTSFSKMYLRRRKKTILF